MFKFMSIFLLSFILCSPTNAFWTRHKEPLEKEFNQLLTQYSIAKKNYEKMQEHSRSWSASLRRAQNTPRVQEAFRNNPELQDKFNKGREINNIFVKMHDHQQKYEYSLKDANKELKDMIEALNKVKELEIQRQGFLQAKDRILESLHNK